jgi:hypothetical protein
MAAEILAGGNPICAGVMRRDLDRELSGEG